MFTPEFVSEEQGEFIFVANHNLEIIESVQFSIKYNKARIAFGATHLPAQIKNCRLIYDIRGQVVSAATINSIKQALEGNCNLEFKS